MRKEEYTLLIVDDEAIISDGLKLLLEEELKGEVKVYNCYGARRALEIFRLRMPDIVLSDVKMPRMNGMEMAKKMHEIKTDTHVLFLSGYDEFELVYSAIKQGADDYILKTEGDEIIVAGVRKMILKVEEARRLNREKENIKDKIEIMEPVYKQQAISGILDGNISSREEFDRCMNRLDDPVENSESLLLLIGNGTEKSDEKVLKEMSVMVSDMLMKSYGNKIEKIHSSRYRGHFVWVMETRGEDLASLLVVSLMDIRSLILESLNRNVHFAIASKPVSWQELGRKHKNLWEQYQRNRINENNYVILESEILSDTTDTEEAGLLQSLGPVCEKLNLLEEWLGGENFAGVTEQLEELLTILSGARRHSMHALEIYYSLANMLISYINKTNIRIKLAAKIRLIELFDPGSFEGWDEAAVYLKQLLACIKETRGIPSGKGELGQSEKVKAYILGHISEDLSLPVIGVSMGFNHVYLSRIFKQEEGISIRDYIEKCRIELAKQLLSNSQMKIYEIGQKCGYQNTTYFIKIFRNHCQVTPQEYRDGRGK